MFRLFSRYWSVPAAMSLIVEGLLLYLAIPFATYLRLGVGPGSPPAHPILLLETITFMGICLLSLYINGLYDFAERLTGRRLTIQLARAFFLAGVALCAVYFLFPKVLTGRGVFLIAFLFASLGIVCWRMLLRNILRSDRFAERILIVGSGHQAAATGRAPPAPARHRR